MINAILRFTAIFVITSKRMFSQRGLVLATSLGIIAAIALSMSIPIYSDAVYQDILDNAVLPGNGGTIAQYSQPVFAYMYRYVGEWSNPVKREKLPPVNAYLSGPVVADLGLTPMLFVKYQKTGVLKLFPAQQGAYDSTKTPLAYVYFSVLSDLGKHITLVEGSMPTPASTEPDSVIDVLVSEDQAVKLGLHQGELFNVYTTFRNQQTTTSSTFPVRVAGIWKANDPAELFWFYNTKEFNEALLIPEKSLYDRVLPYMQDEINHVVWYWILDGSKIQSSQVPELLGRIASTRRKALNLLPDIRLDLSPEKVLQNYQQAAQSLTIYLYAFSIPLLLMILTFIGLVVDMVIERRRNEIAVLRSRGSTQLQVLGMGVLESFLLGTVGLLVGTPAALIVVQFFGKTKSFLDFTASTSLNAQVTQSAVRFGLVTAAVVLAAQVLPTLIAAKHTIISYKQERARQIQPPWWQRTWLDILLLIPAGYVVYLLRQSPGSIVPGVRTALSNDPFQNPLLLLVPALVIFAFTLLLLRLLPFLMSAVAWSASYTHSVGVLMAARFLSRTSNSYSAPLILLVMTLSLSTFTATLAQTLDHHMHDQTFYKVGADMDVMEGGEYTGTSKPAGMGGTAGSNGVDPVNSTTSNGAEPARWIFLPVSEHLKIPGVMAASRIGVADLKLKTSSGYDTATFMGIDRVDFPQVAFWRRDFSPDSLGALMNKLALTDEGVLVSRSLLSSNNLRIGDILQASTYQFDETVELNFRIVGVFDYFPTWYPQEGQLVVGNLDAFFEQIGGQFPYRVWLKIRPNTDYQKLLLGIDGLYHHMLNSNISAGILSTEQLKPQRQGFFGLLSVGFLALALMTVLGFLLYAVFSFQRRFIELGMLRAIGLSSSQMLSFLASELAFLFLTGLGAGTGLGVWVSNFFIPYLQVGNDMASSVPPFVVQIDWSAVFQVYILFGMLFIVALIVLGILLMRMKIFQAIKLGEAV